MVKASDRHPLLDDIEAFLRETGIAESTFGQRASGSWTLVQRLREGGDVRRRTEKRVRAWMLSDEAKKIGPRSRAA
jgi:hypothetical protein